MVVSQISILLLPMMKEMSVAVEEKVGSDQKPDEHVDAQICAGSTHVVDQNDQLHPT